MAALFVLAMARTFYCSGRSIRYPFTRKTGLAPGRIWTFWRV